LANNLSKAIQANFAGGLNAVSAPHLLEQDEVASSTNVDYSLEWGGAPARRGSTVYAQTPALGTSSINISLITRNYALSTGVLNDAVIPWYMAADTGVTYTGSGTATVAVTSMSGYAGGSQTKVPPGATQYHAYTYIANGTSALKTNGTNTYDWLLPKADTPTVVFAQQGTFTGSGTKAGAFVGFGGTMTATEGTVTGSSTSTYFGVNNPVVITTATSGTSSRIVLIGTVAPTNWENPVPFIVPPTGTAVTFNGTTGAYTLGGDIDFHAGYPGGDTFGTYTSTATSTMTMTIGQYGTDYILLGLPDQQSVVTIQRDLSIGDSTFTNYWHSETTSSDIHDSATDPLVLLLAAQNGNSFELQTEALNLSRVIQPNTARRLGPSIPSTRKSIGKTSIAVNISPWGVARGDYKFIGTLPNPGYTDIHAIRIVIEFSTTNKQVLVGGCVTYGALGWSLNDQISGISYYQTYARVENGVIVAEGACSDPSTPSIAQYAYGQLNCAAVTNTTAGITHRVFYRSGGLLQDAHRVGSCSIASGTNTIYDYGFPDMLIVSRPSVKRFLWSQWPSPTAGTGLPGVNAVSEAWQDRVFVGVQNQLYWSVPGVPSQLQEDVQTTVSDVGDPIAAIIPYGNLVVVNQASVYEMAGSVFEGTNANWTLNRSAARRGSAAPKTCIKTPHGVLLFSYDGVSLYRSGYGVDEELAFVQDRIGDLWKGNAASDPASFKSRLPALNHAAIYNACAAYKDEKIYLAVPTGTNTLPDTLITIHMAQKKVWMAQYPFKINSLYWDRLSNRLMAGTEKGTLQQLETGLVDTSPTGTASGIGWSFQTRAWSTPTDLLLENLQIESVGTSTAKVTLDNALSTLGTLTRASKGWTPAAANGTVGDAVSFTFNGTQSGTQQEVYQAQWEFIAQTPKVTFHQTDWYSLKDGSGETAEGWWHKLFIDLDCLGTATVTATHFIDQTAVGTYTCTSTKVGRLDFPFALPEETYGKVGHTVLTASSVFKVYNVSYHVTPEPTPVLFWETSLTALPDENYVKTWLPDLNLLGGTSTARLYLDGVGVSTATLTYSNTAGATTSMRRRIFENGTSNVTVAKNVKVTYTSTTPFKHYKTEYEFEPKPFNKTTWLVTYKRLGGATQLDMARFYAMDLEGTLTATLTSTWIIDGTAFSTNTFTLSGTNVGEVTGVGRTYIDQIPFPPGGRGYLFQQHISSTQEFRVWKSNLDIERVGVKGLSRVTLAGTPQQQG
jgi:hypothetical protein